MTIQESHPETQALPYEKEKEQKEKNDRFGDYKLIRQLGHGGMAEVFLAHAEGPEGFKKKVALKRLLPHMAKEPECVMMFIHEAKLTAQLQHPNIVRVYDFGQMEKTYYISMEYINGVGLGRLIKCCRRDKIPLSLAASVYIIIQILEGLHYAHTARNEQGEVMHLVHRDLTPGNIFISYEGEVKILDFGIAKSEIQDHHTNAGTIKGKMRYMSPEQLQGQNLDARSDLFAMGILLFETTMMRHLFPNKDIQTAMRMICLEPIPRPSHFKPDYPPELEKIVMKALQRNKERRYQTAEEMLRDLRQFLFQTGEFVDRSILKDILQQTFFAPKKKNRTEQVEQPEQLPEQLPEPTIASTSTRTLLPSTSLRKDLVRSTPLSTSASLTPPPPSIPLDAHKLSASHILPPPNNTKLFAAIGTLMLSVLSGVGILWFFAFN